MGLLSNNLNVQKKARIKAGYNYTLGDIEHRLLSKILESYVGSTDGVSVYGVFNDLREIDRGRLSLAAIKLERLGLLDKNIAIDHEYNGGEYFAFTITADGIDYLLENESIVSDF
ncbi:hypothetical protein ACOX9X_13275 [Photobacterium leiognathi subsp. mandapamensis]|uniref:hypothetical protein n=1 Tax=Photobacterium leiognathi TaxID=553611 RepID=UPI003BF4F7CC